MADGINLGKAWVQIVPSAQGIQGSIAGVLDKESTTAGISAGKKFSSGLGSALKGGAGVMLAGTAAIGTAVVGLTKDLVSGTSQVAEYGDNIDKMSQKMGISAEAYQEWEAVMQHSGTSMETMKTSMKTLASAAETGKDAFEALGITQEELASMSQEDLFEATIAGLQNLDDETQRTYLAGQLLGRGATELGALLNTSAEDTQAMRDRVRELGGVMSEEAVKSAAAFQDQLQDMQTAFQGISRNLMTEFLPGITTVMSGLTEIFSGNSDEGLKQISSGIDDVVTKIGDNLPKITEVGMTIVESIAKAILDNLPKVLEAGTDIVFELVDFIIENAPSLLESLITGITMILDELVTALPELLPKIISLLVDLTLMIIEALPDILISLIEALPIIIESLLVDGIPELVEGLIRAVAILVTHYPEIIAAVIGAIPDIILAILTALGPIVDGLFELFMRAWETVKEIFADPGAFFSEKFQNAKDLIAQVWASIGEWASGVWEDIKGPFADIGGWFKEKFENAVQIIGTVLFQLPMIVINIKNRIFETFLDVYSRFTEIGGNIVEGIKNGIANAWESLKSWFSGLFDGLIGTAKDILGIHSPSRVFAEIGQNTVAGFDEGMETFGEGAENSVKSAIDDLANVDVPLLATDLSVNGEMTATANQPDMLSALNTIINLLQNGNNVNISLQGDAQGLFTAVRDQNRVYKRMNGESAFA